MIKRKDGFNGERALVLPLSVVQEMEKDALSSVLHITDIGYYPKALHHFRERTEPISQFVFIYCIEGAGWFRIGEQGYAVKANQYFILPAGIPHAYGSDESNPWTIYWIHFKGKLASYFAGQANRPIDIKPSIQSRISNRNDLFEEIFHTLEWGIAMRISCMPAPLSITTSDHYVICNNTVKPPATNPTQTISSRQPSII